MLPPSTDMWNGLACPSEHPASPFAYASPHGCLAHLFIVLLTFIRAFYSREKRNKSFDVTIPLLLPLLLLVFVCHHHGGGYRGLYQLWTTDCPPSHGAFSHPQPLELSYQPLSLSPCTAYVTAFHQYGPRATEAIWSVASLRFRTLIYISSFGISFLFFFSPCVFSLLLFH